MRLFLCLALIVVLGGCGERHAAETRTFDPPQTPGGRMCINECSSGQDSCNEACDLTHRRCTGDVQQQALLDYDKYTREQFAAGEPMDLYPRDFERLGPCNDAHDHCSADCQRDYRSCYKNCGGAIDTQSSCQFLCF